MANISKVELNGTTYNINTSGSIPESEKGAANGVASLDSSGKVPSSQLPSYVDDVLEYSAKSSFPATGETGKIYVDTTTNKTYRWSGSAYVEISESLALGEKSSTAYRGDRGKAAYDHSRITNGNPHGTTGANTKLTGYSKGSSKDAVAATDTVNAAIAKHENRINANQTNILYSTRTGAQNLIECSNVERLKQINTYPSWTWIGNTYKHNTSGATFTVNGDGSITVNGTFTDQTFFYINDDGKYEDTARFKGLATSRFWGCPEGGSDTTHFLCFHRVSPNYYWSDYGEGCDIGTIETTQKIDVFIVVRGNTTVSNKTYYPSFTLKSIYNQDSSFCPGALPNYDLTRLEAEDRTMLNGIVLNSAKTSGSLNDETNHFTLCSPDVTNKPVADVWGYCKTAKYNADLIQEYTTVQTTTKTFRRIYSGGNWTHWTPLGTGYTVYMANTSILINHTYHMSKKDFMLPNTDSASSSGDSSGIYLIYMISWAVSPTISVYAVGYSGGDFSYAKNCVQKIAGADVNVTVSSEGLITVPYKGKVQIIALT